MLYTFLVDARTEGSTNVVRIGASNCAELEAKLNNEYVGWIEVPVEQYDMQMLGVAIEEFNKLTGAQKAEEAIVEAEQAEKLPDDTSTST